ncbi:MAG: hypothetical protein IKB96_05720 [Prevotella sp.]|nr:hypothetical protein [Prevotella sp.]
MSYDVFVSYSMGYSSRAYELSAQLSRENVQCYLDCAESGFTLGDYTRNLVEESRVYVMLIGANFMSSNYAMASVQCAAGMVKPMLACLADGAKVPEELRERCTFTTEASLLEDILCLLRDEEDDDVDMEAEPGSLYSATPSTAPFVPLEVETTPLDESAFGSKVVGYEPSKSKTIEYGTEDEPIEEHPHHSKEFASFDWQPLSSSADSVPAFTITPAYEDDTEEEEYEDEYEDSYTPEEDGVQIEPLYTEHRGEDPISELDRSRNEAKMRELERDLLTHNDSDEEELEQPSPLDLMQKLSDFFDKNPRVRIALLIFLILTLLEYCS